MFGYLNPITNINECMCHGYFVHFSATTEILVLGKNGPFG